MPSYINPFITSGYISPEYFCDRETESNHLMNELINGNNIALISTRRMGKTGLILHCFNDKRIKKQYYTFFIDIYATKSLREFIFAISKEILEGLKPFGRKALEAFLSSVKSIQGGISFNAMGVPSFKLSLGDIKSEETTLEEIFNYLANADKQCIVAIDEFQQIAGYTEKNVEALLRTYIQHCTNARFIFAGSQRHVMGNMFTSAARPFYQSTSMLYLESIDLDEYTKFAERLFDENFREITPETVFIIYERFDGITWYMQKMLNTLYANTSEQSVCTKEMIAPAQEYVINSYRYSYSETLFRLPEKQKELLIAIAKEGKASAITSANFIQKHKLKSASSVQAAQKVLLEKDYITSEKGEFIVYDRFFGIWLNENF